MTAVFTFLWMTSKVLGLEDSPQITNPLPVMKGQIGRGSASPSGSSSIKTKTDDGFAPLNPAELPGVLFAITGSPVSQKAKVQAPKPKTSPSASTELPQGENTAFNRAIDKLFKLQEPKVEPKPVPSETEPEKTSLSESVAPPASPIKATEAAEGSAALVTLVGSAKPQTPRAEALEVRRSGSQAASSLQPVNKIPVSKNSATNSGRVKKTRSAKR